MMQPNHRLKLTPRHFLAVRPLWDAERQTNLERANLHEA
jgi:hypothetical protein